MCLAECHVVDVCWKQQQLFPFLALGSSGILAAHSPPGSYAAGICWMQELLIAIASMGRRAVSRRSHNG